MKKNHATISLTLAAGHYRLASLQFKPLPMINKKLFVNNPSYIIFETNILMKTTLSTIVLGAASLLFAACNNSSESNNTNKETAQAPAPAAPQPIKLGPVSASPEFPNASLAIQSVKAVKAGDDSAKVTFNFDVKNYELKMQTTDNANKLCNNSDKGQHIHFILDNQPYKALYDPTNDVTLANNTEHYLMAFLSRSYHESIKSKGAAVVYHFKIDEKGNLKKLNDPKTPMLFYSRPKGDYMGKDTTNVLLDFYVWNCDLAADGYKVKASVLGANHTDTASFTFDKWEPKFIQNLSIGKSTVVLTLVDKNGAAVTGPQTGTSREINLIAQEPINK